MFDIRGLFTGGKHWPGWTSVPVASSLRRYRILQRPRPQPFFPIPLAKGVIVDGAVAEPEALTATIKELYKQSGCKRRKIVTSISGNAVIVKKATFAQMDEEELRTHP